MEMGMGTSTASSAGGPPEATRLEEMLAALPMQRLRALATARAIDTRASSRHELVQRVAADLGDATATARALAACPPERRMLLDYAMLWEGEPPLAVLTAAGDRLATDLGGAAPVDQGADAVPEHAPERAGERAVDDLVGLGLVVVDAAPALGTGGPTALGMGGGRAPDPPATAGPRAYVPLAVRGALGQTVEFAPPPTMAMPPGSMEIPAAPALLPLLLRCWAEARAAGLSAPAGRRTSPLERYYLHLQGWHNVFDEVERLAGRGPGRWHGPDPHAVLSVAQPPVGLAQEDRRRLMAALGCSERQLAFAFRLLRAGGLLAATPTGFSVAAEAMLTFLARCERERLRLLAGVWLEDTSWSELFQVRELNVARYAADEGYKQEALLADLARARRLIARALGRLTPEAWYTTTGFLAGLRRVEPDLPVLALPSLAPRSARARPAVAMPPAVRALARQRGTERGGRPHTPWVLRAGVQQRPLDLRAEEDWLLAAGGFVARILLGPLHWLGAVELALSPVHEHLPDHQAVVGFRVTALGRYLLAAEGADATLDATGEGAPAGACACLRLDEQLTVQATDATPAAVHQRLRQVGTAAIGDDMALRYALDPRRLAQAAEARRAAEGLVELLQEHSIPPVPPAAWDVVRGWRDRAGQVLLYPRVSVLEVADATALDEVLAATNVRQALLCRLSDHALLIESTAVSQLLGELAAQGYTPRLRRDAP
jgi:hypothetical protein